MINRIICILILAALLTVVAVGIADSASFTYSSHRKEIKAGVLIFPNASGAYLTPAPAPYVFHVLNQRTDVKPQGWDFVNPVSPSRVSDEIRVRWSGVGGTAYNLGDQVNKDMGCYWEVKIDAGFKELSQFDVLYVGLGDSVLLGNYALGRHYREKLRKLVDAGGMLWVENCTTGGVTLGGFITPDLVFGNGSGGWAGAPNLVHPLVHRPYDLSWDELHKLGPIPMRWPAGVHISPEVGVWGTPPMVTCIS